MKVTLDRASNQWATRPADERHESLPALDAYCNQMRREALQDTVPWSDLRVEADGGEVKVVGKKNIPARLTNYSFGQIARRIGAPADFLGTLPATLACQNINHLLAEYGKTRDDKKPANLLFRVNGHVELRCAMTDVYNRIWNNDITSRLLKLEENGWRVPPARPAMADQPGTRLATEADVLRHSAHPTLGVKIGDPIAPAGLYASDRDMFAFLINEESPINDGSGNPMFRGFFVWNSEVGDKSLGIETFLFQSVCGNQIVWGAENVQTIRIRHTGQGVDTRAWFALERSLNAYSHASAADTEASIKKARTQIIAATKDELLDKLFGIRSLGLTRKVLEAGYAASFESYDEHKAAPTSKWGMVEGITRVSRDIPHADTRINLDRAAGKLMRMEF